MTERFGQFEIERPLGQGGMAETLLAVRRGPDGFEQRVCLKRILPAFGRDPEFVRAFQNEAKLAVRLVHPHICRIYDYGNHQGRLWMSMELVDAGDLRSLFGGVQKLGQPLPTDLVLLLAVDLASALHHAHTFRIDGKPADIVHRDVSPSNLLIDGAGHFKLADFGIAKATLSGEGGTRTGSIKGKVPYMAPEHATGGKIDGRADLWSFGVVLYEALAGRRPFRAGNDMELVLMLAKGEYEALATAAPHAPPALQRLVAGLLEPDLQKRIAKAADVLELLSASPPPPTARLRLADLVIRIADARARGDERAIGEATTAWADAGGTSMSPAEPTHMAQGGVALAPARQPVSAAADAPTRTVAASVPSMDTRPLEAAIPKTDPQHQLSSGVREALAIEEAIRKSDSALEPATTASATPFAVEGPSATATVPTPSTADRRLPALAAFSALAAILGLGLTAWGLGAFDSSPSPVASGPVAAASPPVVEAPPPSAPPVTTAPPSPPAAPEPAPVAAPPVALVPEPVPPPVVLVPPAPAEPVVPEEEVAAAPPPEVTDPPAEAATPRTAETERSGRTATLVIGIVGRADIWVDGRRVAEDTDFLERRVRPGRHTVAVGVGSPGPARSVECGDGERCELDAFRLH